MSPNQFRPPDRLCRLEPQPSRPDPNPLFGGGVRRFTWLVDPHSDGVPVIARTGVRDVDGIAPVDPGDAIDEVAAVFDFDG